MSRPRVLAWLLGLGALGVLLLGVLAPNRQQLQVVLFWHWSWQLPLWAVLLVGVAVGAGLGGGLVGTLWLLEWRRRAQAERRANQIQVEVNQLRRLLARPLPGGAIATERHPVDTAAAPDGIPATDGDKAP